jgi:hypothetical protein
MNKWLKALISVVGAIIIPAVFFLSIYVVFTNKWFLVAIGIVISVGLLATLAKAIYKSLDWR